MMKAVASDGQTSFNLQQSIFSKLFCQCSPSQNFQLKQLGRKGEQPGRQKLRIHPRVRIAQSSSLLLLFVLLSTTQSLLHIYVNTSLESVIILFYLYFCLRSFAGWVSMLKLFQAFHSLCKKNIPPPSHPTNFHFIDKFRHCEGFIWCTATANWASTSSQRALAEVFRVQNVQDKLLLRYTPFFQTRSMSVSSLYECFVCLEEKAVERRR